MAFANVFRDAGLDSLQVNLLSGVFDSLLSQKNHNELLFNTIEWVRSSNSRGEKQRIVDFFVENADLTPKELLFRAAYNDNARKNYEEEIDSSVYKAKRSDSVYQCGKCKSNKVDITALQLRSADEPMTIFANCTNCGKEWQESG